jgi:hypothetical protein
VSNSEEFSSTRESEQLTGGHRAEVRPVETLRRRPLVDVRSRGTAARFLAEFLRPALRAVGANLVGVLPSSRSGVSSAFQPRPSTLKAPHSPQTRDSLMPLRCRCFARQAPYRGPQLPSAIAADPRRLPGEPVGEHVRSDVGDAVLVDPGLVEVAPGPRTHDLACAIGGRRRIRRLPQWFSIALVVRDDDQGGALGRVAGDVPAGVGEPVGAVTAVSGPFGAK